VGPEQLDDATTQYNRWAANSDQPNTVAIILSTTAMQALFIAWYNFGRKHEALKGNTPAMASGLSDHIWTIKKLIEKAARVS
jgi:hypothetical protein